MGLYTVTIEEDGGIVVPPGVLAKMGINDGGTVVIGEIDGQLVIRRDDSVSDETSSK